MCGIAGIISKEENINLNSEINKMLEAIVHRGPDGDGVFIEKNIAFGHRRLAIIDLTDNASQPMFYEEKYVIVFNGEIYNYIEIKKILSEKGYIFKNNSDTEVILAAYDFWGVECVHQFNGMWSFSIYDKTKQVIFCSRDRFGVKPFYYTVNEGKFYFASEIKQLLNNGIEAKANNQILMDYLILGLEDHKNETFFKNIFKLPASNNLIYNLKTNKFEINKYYTLKPNPEYFNISEEKAIEIFKKEINRSLTYRLRSDVKVGTCLSGGLDSSLIASLASKLYKENSNQKFSAITAQSTEKEKDETNYAKKIVDKYDLNWLVVKPSFENFSNDLYSIIKSQEEPFGSPSIYMQNHVMKIAKENGCIVLLDGQGGDETMLGYERYYSSNILSLPFYKIPFAIIKSGINSKLGILKVLKYLFYFGSSKLRTKTIKKRMKFLSKEAINYADFTIFNEIAKCNKDTKKLQILELTKTQLPHLLKYEDRNSMLHSIETRLPFLDYKLVEFLISIPNELKIKDGWTKYILRKSAKDILPDEIAWRKNKFGFEAPENTWLENKEYILNEIKQSKILNKYIVGEIPINDNRILWKLLNIAIWEKCYEVN